MKIYVDAYLFGNLGDDLFVDMLIKRYPKIQFYTISQYAKSKDNLHVYHNKIINKIFRNKQLKEKFMNKFDGIITIGGSMFMEKSDTSKDIQRKKDYYVLGSNFGPYQTEEYYKKYYNFFSKAKDVCFREKYSYQLFKDLPNVRQAPDIVFGMDTKNIKCNMDKKVVISVISCKDKIGEQYQKIYEQKIREMITFFKKKDYEVCLMSFCQIQGDEQAINSIISENKETVSTYFYRGNIEEALSVIANCQIVVGSRFHANILGLLFGKTIIPIAYSDKTKNVLQDMNYKGEILDIKQMEKLDVNELEKFLELKQDVEEQIENAEKQFEKLDDFFRRDIKWTKKKH